MQERLKYLLNQHSWISGRSSSAVSVVLLMLLWGCATYRAPSVDAAVGSSIGNEVAMRAIAMVGTPYRYGGEGPDAFDCSGLVRYIFRDLGVHVPRTAAEQHAAARPVKLHELAPGDLLFFKIRGKSISHVAIYAGESRFIHAPQTGRTVELRTLDDQYYRPRLVGAGRLF